MNDLLVLASETTAWNPINLGELRETTTASDALKNLFPADPHFGMPQESRAFIDV
jgi:hypothetical protein